MNTKYFSGSCIPIKIKIPIINEDKPKIIETNKVNSLGWIPSLAHLGKENTFPTTKNAEPPRIKNKPLLLSEIQLIPKVNDKKIPKNPKKDKILRKSLKSFGINVFLFAILFPKPPK